MSRRRSPTAISTPIESAGRHASQLAADLSAPASLQTGADAGVDEDWAGVEVAESVETYETRRAPVPESLHGERLDKVLVSMAPEFSRSHLQTLIFRALVKVSGSVATSASQRMRAGQEVEISLAPTAESSAYRPEAMALDIVFEDEHVLVINKPPGLVVHPAPGHWSGTLLNGVLAHHPGAARLPRAGVVHRLDKDTSGLMVVAKTLEAQTALVRSIAAREVSRIYVALVWRDVEPEPFSIEMPIGRDPISRVRMAVVHSGKPARTDVRCVVSTLIASGPDLRHQRVSLVRCQLHTGRTHQIRVHLTSRGHPLLADSLYGGLPALGLQRQALHARRLAFDHPHSGELHTFTAELPTDLADALKTLVGAAALVATMQRVDEAHT